MATEEKLSTEMAASTQYKVDATSEEQMEEQMEETDKRVTEIKRKIKKSFERQFEARSQIVGGLDTIIQFYVQSLSNIDSSAQTFQAVIEMKLFRELSNAELIEMDSSPTTFSPNMPYIFPLHAQEVLSFETVKWYNGRRWHIRCSPDDYRGAKSDSDSDSGTDKVYVFVVYLWNVVFQEDFELENFPFDVQHFNIGFQIDARDMLFTPNYKNMNGKSCNEKMYFNDKKCAVFIPSFATNLLGWDFYTRPHLEIYPEYCAPNVYDHTILKFNAIFALTRNWQFYAFRVIVVLGIMSFLSTFSFLIDATSFGDILAYISTVLLGVIAYMFIVTSYLPPLKYFTLVDYYIFFTFALVFIIACQCAVFNGLAADSIDVIKNIDDVYIIAFFANLLFWFLVHILFIYFACKSWKVEMAKLNKSKFEIDDEAVEFYLFGDPKSDENVTVVSAKGKDVYLKTKFEDAICS